MVTKKTAFISLNISIFIVSDSRTETSDKSGVVLKSRIIDYGHKVIEKKIIEFVSTGIEWIPINKIVLDKEKKKSVLSFLETLEDDDDVQHVYANLELGNNFLDGRLKT